MEAGRLLWMRRQTSIYRESQDICPSFHKLKCSPHFTDKETKVRYNNKAANM